MSDSDNATGPVRGGGAIDFLHLVAFVYIVGSIIGAIIVFLEFGIREVLGTFGYTTEVYLPAAVAGAGILLQGLAIGMFLWVVGNMADDLADIRQAVRGGKSNS